MKLLKIENNHEYQEIEVEKSFFGFKWKTIYRKFGAAILRYKHPNKYYNLGLSEYFEIHEFFNVKKLDV